MKVSFVPIQSSIDDWITDSGIGHQEIEESTLLKWATDAIRMVTTDEQLVPKVTLLQVRHFKAELPDDFKMLANAAANPDYTPDCTDCPEYTKHPYYSGYHKTRREDIIQWAQYADDGCELEINLVCPTCSKTDCSCDRPIVEVDVDRIWEMAHPEIYYTGINRIGRFGYGPMGPNHHPKFHIMRYATQDYWNLKYFLTDCPNVRCDDCYHSFRLDLPYIEVDFEKGEVLLSYLGKKLDPDGNLMIPDHQDVHEAIYWHLEAKWWWRQWRRHSKPADQAKAEQSMMKRDECVMRANSVLGLPEAHQLQNFLDNVWNKRVPDRNNLLKGNKLTPSEHEAYLRMIEGKRPGKGRHTRRDYPRNDYY